jgi:hypothetical protein
MQTVCVSKPLQYVVRARDGRRYAYAVRPIGGHFRLFISTLLLKLENNIYNIRKKSK